MNKQLEKDLQDTMNIISADWNMQNNRDDKNTNFIYKANSLDKCLEEIKRTGADKDYALHRWYNFKTSEQCESIFCEYGAVPEKDPYNHDVDIYIDGDSYDVKLTVYPQKLSAKPFDLTTREGKDDMIRWYYGNQSQQGRKQLINRLYVVCDASSANDNLRMKSDFDLMRQKISEFMDSVKENGVNEIVIEDGGKQYKVKSDIIHLSK